MPANTTEVLPVVVGVVKITPPIRVSASTNPNPETGERIPIEANIATEDTAPLNIPAHGVKTVVLTVYGESEIIKSPL